MNKKIKHTSDSILSPRVPREEEDAGEDIASNFISRDVISRMEKNADEDSQLASVYWTRCGVSSRRSELRIEDLFDLD